MDNAAKKHSFSLIYCDLHWYFRFCLHFFWYIHSCMSALPSKKRWESKAFVKLPFFPTQSCHVFYFLNSLNILFWRQVRIIHLLQNCVSISKFSHKNFNNTHPHPLKTCIVNRVSYCNNPLLNVLLLLPECFSCSAVFFQSIIFTSCWIKHDASREIEQRSFLAKPRSNYSKNYDFFL